MILNNFKNSFANSPMRKRRMLVACLVSYHDRELTRSGFISCISTDSRSPCSYDHAHTILAIKIRIIMNLFVLLIIASEILKLLVFMYIFVARLF